MARSICKDVQARIDFTWREPELENEYLSKLMNRWIRFRLEVVSLITNDENQYSRVATDFDDMNKEFFFYGLFINVTLLSKSF